MSSVTDVPLTSGRNSDADDELWTDLYFLLRPLAKVWAYNAGVPIWKGQEHDIAEDIVQTALLKLLGYIKETRENGTAIDSLEHLSVVIAKHSFLDMRRRELRLQHFSHDTSMPREQLSLDRLTDPSTDPSQEAEEKIYEEWLLAISARTITAFSKKLRAAILADLANNSYFDDEPTALQQAFLAVGIRLQDHQRAPSADPAERGRQSALRSLAYKRLSQANIG